MRLSRLEIHERAQIFGENRPNWTVYACYSLNVSKLCSRVYTLPQLPRTTGKGLVGLKPANSIGASRDFGARAR